MSGHEAADWRMQIRPTDTAFFLDVDGTLLDFKDRPEDVAADPALVDLLVRLCALANGAVALVSGRMVSDLDRIMTPLVLPAGGVHGADMRFADGRRAAFEGAALTDVRTAADLFVAERPGLTIEDKGGTTFAIHYRRAPDRAEEVAQFLRRTLSGHDLMVQHGKMVAEVKPSGCHKGLAIASLMESRPFAGRVPLFVGDDLTDEHGFDAVNKAGGVSIKVGGVTEETVARHRLADVQAVREFLSIICRLGEVH